jgi:hypothetical protein
MCAIEIEDIIIIIQLRRAGSPAKYQETFRAVSSAIIGEGRLYSYIRVLPDGFLLKAIVFTLYEHGYINYIFNSKPGISLEFGT